MTREPAEVIYQLSGLVTRNVSNQDASRRERDDDHLQDVEDGCGCTEVWEHMSDQRED